MIDRTPASIKRRGDYTTIQQTCVICGAVYLIPRHIAHRYTTCSRECSSTRRQTPRVEHPTLACAVCGASFTIIPAKEATARYCSDDCRMIGLNSAPRERSSGLRSLTISVKGYRRGWYWDESLQSWRSMLEHRWVMEHHLGRPLTRAERIHHLNGNRADNRIENLELCASHSEHMRRFHASPPTPDHQPA